MKEIGIQRAIEEVSIDGKAYKIDLSDSKKRKYTEIYTRLQKVGKEFEDVSKINDADVLKQALEDMKTETKAITNELLGKGAFDEIYPKTNESTENTFIVLMDVMTYIREKQEELYKEKFEKKKAKYVKKR